MAEDNVSQRHAAGLSAGIGVWSSDVPWRTLIVVIAVIVVVLVLMTPTLVLAIFVLLSLPVLRVILVMLTFVELAAMLLLPGEMLPCPRKLTDFRLLPALLLDEVLGDPI